MQHIIADKANFELLPDYRISLAIAPPSTFIFAGAMHR